MTGFGKMTYRDGSTYEGEWLDGYQNGNGKINRADGSKYEG